MFEEPACEGHEVVIDILSDPYCEVIWPITIVYNLIEVNKGQRWLIREWRFIDRAIEESRIGLVTPRRFCPCECTSKKSSRTVCLKMRWPHSAKSFSNYSVIITRPMKAQIHARGSAGNGMKTSHIFIQGS